MSENYLSGLMQPFPSGEELWNGAYKIPWDEPGFSRRMLKEHLSQDHGLASRKQATIDSQVAWIGENFLSPGPARVLDLACGPGLYAPGFCRDGHQYLGIDFGPASIEYARQNFGDGERCRFALDDLRTADFGSGHDLVMMIYGEPNVFPRADLAAILIRAEAALKPGGRLLLEVHRKGPLENGGQGRQWERSAGGLFSERPHLILTESLWYAREAVLLQVFHVVDPDTGRLTSYRSTTRAYDHPEYLELLLEAGLAGAELRPDWPEAHPAMVLYQAFKP